MELNGITTFQSGFTLSPTTSVNTCVCGNSLARPNVERDPRLSGSERSRTVGSMFQHPLFRGNTRSETLAGGYSWPGVLNFDLNIAKRFRLPWREGMNIEYRAELYNLFNTPQFADPNTSIGTATAGRITGARNERQGQMALKLYF